MTIEIPDLAMERLNAVRQRIRMAEQVAGRPEQAVSLVAVSKTQSASAIQALFRLGQRDFGENYLQEAIAKQDELDETGIVWHFIGPIQSNKTKLIASRFDWVHSVDRLSVAERLSRQRPDGLPPLNVCIQVNISQESSKSGASLESLPDLAAAIASLPGLRLRGLMAIPEPESDTLRQREPFRALRMALEKLPVPGLDTLSMGMSDDLEAAILEGATLVRIGTALFGSRSARPVAHS